LEKEQYFKFFNTSTDIMGITNSLGHFVKINPAFGKMFGYLEHELLAKPFIEFVHPDDIKVTLREMHTNLEAGLSVQFENRFLAKDGSHKWLSWTAHLNREDNLTYATARDITKKKKTETALIESEKNLQTIFELTPIPLVITKFYDGTIMMANEATELLLGYKLKEIVGKYGIDYFMSNEHQEILQTELAKKGKASFIEVVLKTAKNDLLTCLVSCEIIYINGEIALISSVLDITDRKKFEEELIAKNLELKKANVELDRFVYSTSHDLRAPLLSVLGLVEICEGYNTEHTELQSLYKMMRTSISRSDDTIKSILDYSRNARLDPQPEKLDVKRIAEIHIENIKHMKEAKGVEFILDIDNNVDFFADSMRFTTIIHNLITNGVKYQRNNEPNPFVHVRFFCNSKEAVLEVSDNGEGISNEKINKIFGMFVRLSTKSSGSGLGLYRCKEMVLKMGGDIDVKSEIHRGTTFIVNLPNRIN
jgi:PAS domain S-box-containing protein